MLLLVVEPKSLPLLRSEKAWKQAHPDFDPLGIQAMKTVFDNCLDPHKDNRVPLLSIRPFMLYYKEKYPTTGAHRPHSFLRLCAQNLGRHDSPEAP